MVTSREFPSQVYEAGTHSVELNAIPAGTATARFRLTREAWPDALRLAIIVQYSSDNGATWANLFTADVAGGIETTPRGHIATASGFGFSWPSDGTDLRLRITSNMEFRTAIAFEAE
jgi:hypothetical protein